MREVILYAFIQVQNSIRAYNDFKLHVTYLILNFSYLMMPYNALENIKVSNLYFVVIKVHTKIKCVFCRLLNNYMPHYKKLYFCEKKVIFNKFDTVNFFLSNDYTHRNKFN